MGVIFWWMLLLWVVAGVVYWLVRYRLLGKQQPNMLNFALPAAHTRRLTALPEYVALLKRYRLLVRSAAIALSFGLLASILLTSRPATVSSVTPIEQNRDIMLCLDASGSVLREDATLLDRFSTMVQNFSGQRFGLTLFNSSAVSVIPLNDNYHLITKQLKVAAQAFKTQQGAVFRELTDGTLAGYSSGTSLVSDGVASCIDQLGTNPGHRAQSIVLGTDNEVNGKPIVSMTQVIDLAQQRNIHVFPIDPGVSDPTLASDHADLKILAQQTGGAYFLLSNANTVNSLIGIISQQNPENFIGVPQPATNDDPVPFLIVATLTTVVSLVLIWRLEL